MQGGGKVWGARQGLGQVALGGHGALGRRCATGVHAPTLSCQGLSGERSLQHSWLVAESTRFRPSGPRLRFTFFSSRGWGCGDLEQTHGGAVG